MVNGVPAGIVRAGGDMLGEVFREVARVAESYPGESLLSEVRHPRYQRGDARHHPFVDGPKERCTMSLPYAHVQVLDTSRSPVGDIRHIAPRSPGNVSPIDRPGLFAVYVTGTRDLIAMPSERSATECAGAINASLARIAAAARGRDLPPAHARVVPWPGSAAEHARELADYDAEIAVTAAGGDR